MRLLSPAYYAAARGGWSDYLGLLHPPYTLWHLSYVAMGAAAAPVLHPDRLAGTVLAFFLAVGVAAHALDELHGRPLKTQIPTPVLVALSVGGLGGATVLGIAASLIISPWVLPFVVFGVTAVIVYNLEWFGGRLHSDLGFALCWGAFPALVGYWANAERLDVTAVLLALACLVFSMVQRRLSNHVRTVRRRTLEVDGTMRLDGGEVQALSPLSLLSPAEPALRLMTFAVVLLAIAMLASHVE